MAGELFDGDPPVPVDADHISIVKPFHRFSVLYARTRDFIASNPAAPEAQEGSLDICPLPPIRSEQSLNVFPKLGYAHRNGCKEHDDSGPYRE